MEKFSFQITGSQMDTMWSKPTFFFIYSISAVLYLSQEEIEALHAQSDGAFLDTDDPDFEMTIKDKIMSNQTESVVGQAVAQR